MFDELKEVFSFSTESGERGVHADVVEQVNELSAAEIMVDQAVNSFEAQIEEVQTRIGEIARQTNTLIAGAVERVEETISSLHEAIGEKAPQVVPQAEVSKETGVSRAVDSKQLTEQELRIIEARMRLQGVDTVDADNSQFALFA